MDWRDDPERGFRRGLRNPTRMANALTVVALLVGGLALVLACAIWAPDDSSGRDSNLRLALLVFLVGLVVTMVLAGFAALLHWCAALYHHLTDRDRGE
jgi:K+-transporting ATPase A subunit